MTRLYSWNVNGIRAATRNGFLLWLTEERPDILCLQEIKAYESDVGPDVLRPAGYTSVWQPAKRKGYSGTATYFRDGCQPTSVAAMGVTRFDDEGRVQVLTFPDFTLINAYYPNSQPERARLDYKLDFCSAMAKLCNRLVRAGGNVIVCGDFNIAHKPIDLARPRENRDNPGFYPEECARLDRFAKAGYVDTFRRFNQDPGQYTWWSYRAQARAKNIGWRLDYHWVNKAFLPRVAAATIHAQVMGSDHCPVSITID